MQQGASQSGLMMTAGPDVAKRKLGRPALTPAGCQVCGADLSGLRLFHQRYHICNEHMMAKEVVVGGVAQRFCQQCGRFHDLDRFATGMRSCRQQLAKHAERRRRGRALAAAQANSSASAAGNVQQQAQLAAQRRAQLAAAAVAGLQAQAAVHLRAATPAPGDAGASAAAPTAPPSPGSPGGRPAPLAGISGLDALLAAAATESAATEEAELRRKRARHSLHTAAPALQPGWYAAVQPQPQPLAVTSMPWPGQQAPVGSTALPPLIACTTAPPHLQQQASVPATPPAQAELQQLLAVLLRAAGGATSSTSASAAQPVMLAPKPEPSVDAAAPALAPSAPLAPAGQGSGALQQLLAPAGGSQDREAALAALFRAAVSGIMASIMRPAS